MKVWHSINFLIIFLFIIGVCVLEETVVSSSLKLAQKQVSEIEQYIDGKDSLLDMTIENMVDNLEYRWSKNESTLCFMVNHKSIQELGMEISKMKSYIENDDIDAFKVSLEQIQYFCRSYLHFMGASLHNVL